MSVFGTQISAQLYEVQSWDAITSILLLAQAYKAPALKSRISQLGGMGYLGPPHLRKMRPWASYRRAHKCCRCKIAMPGKCQLVGQSSSYRPLACDLETYLCEDVVNISRSDWEAAWMQCLLCARML